MNIQEVLDRMWGKQSSAKEMFQKFTELTKEVDWDRLHRLGKGECLRENGVVPLDVYDLDGKVPYRYGLKIYRDGKRRTDSDNPLHAIRSMTRELCRYPVFAEHLKEGGVIYIPSYFGSNVDVMYFSDNYINSYM